LAGVPFLLPILTLDKQRRIEVMQNLTAILRSDLFMARFLRSDLAKQEIKY